MSLVQLICKHVNEAKKSEEFHSFEVLNLERVKKINDSLSNLMSKKEKLGNDFYRDFNLNSMMLFLNLSYMLYNELNFDQSKFENIMDKTVSCNESLEDEVESLVKNSHDRYYETDNAALISNAVSAIILTKERGENYYTHSDYENNSISMSDLLIETLTVLFYTIVMLNNENLNKTQNLDDEDQTTQILLDLESNLITYEKYLRYSPSTIKQELLYHADLMEKTANKLAKRISEKEVYILNAIV